MSSSPVNQARVPAPIADSSHPSPARVAFVRSELYNELASTLQHLGKRSNSLLSPLTSSWLLESLTPTHPPPPLTSATGRRTLMADAAVIACGFLDAPNVTAVELTPVHPFAPLMCHIAPQHSLIWVRLPRMTYRPFTPTTTCTHSRPLTPRLPHEKAPAAAACRSSKTLDCLFLLGHLPHALFHYFSKSLSHVQ